MCKEKEREIIEVVLLYGHLAVLHNILASWLDVSR